MADVFVCKEGEISDGKSRIITTGELEIGIVRHQGQYFAYRNLCPHQGGPVCEGIRVAQVVDIVEPDRTLGPQAFDEADMHIVCPWHGYEYHIVDGTNVCDPKIRLQKFPIVQRGGEIYVSV